MPTKIVSFGYKHHSERGHVVDLPNDALVVDLTTTRLRNPWGQTRLRPLTGLDLHVQQHIRRTPGFDVLLMEIIHRTQDWEGPVYVGCIGGRHRSVFLAEVLGRELKCPVEHLDKDKP
jgi:UPF0042 nucleotide-binding protein